LPLWVTEAHGLPDKDPLRRVFARHGHRCR
jgi:hypothetical protein